MSPVVNLEVLLSLLLSIVIPAWNASKTIEKCLDSLQNQTIQPKEIILVDDGSDDTTVSIATKYKTINIKTGGRKGPATARNMGAEAATGDIVLFLDSDVIVQNDLIEKVLSHFQDESVWAVQTLYTPTCPAQNPVSLYQNYYYYYSLNRMAGGDTATFATWCAAIRRDKFAKIGGFNVRIPEPTVEDEELGYTIVEKGGRIILDKSLLVTHLASYTLKQFTIRRLRMARAQAKSGWRQIKSRLLARYINVHESGTHHSRWVVLSILLVLFAQIALLASILFLSQALLLTSLLLFAVALSCHTAFFKQSRIDVKQKSLLTFIVLCLFDMAVLGWGIMHGSIQYLFGKKY